MEIFNQLKLLKIPTNTGEESFSKRVFHAINTTVIGQHQQQ